MEKENNYIDIHAHILPGVDDGSHSMDETVRMLKIALEQGIRTIIATPHYMAGGNNSSVKRLIQVRNQVQAEAEKIDKELKILLGNEIYYSDSIINALKIKDALTLAGSRYVLVEFSVRDPYERIFRGLGELIRTGYVPILAHVERYQCLYKKEHLISEIVKLGCYVQMNSSSLLGGIFNSEANFNKRILNNSLVHFIGSDCHDAEVRTPLMEAAVGVLSKKSDESLVNRVFKVNPNNILTNTYI